MVHHVTHGDEAYKKVEKEHEDNVANMTKMLDEMSALAPVQMGLFATHQAARLTLLGQRAAVEHLMHEGALSDLDGRPMIAKIGSKLVALQQNEHKRPLRQKIKASVAQVA